MKLFVAIAALVAVTMAAEQKDYPSEFGGMQVSCVNKTVEQIGCEVRASLEYLKFGTYWSMDNTNRPGFAKFFFESASEEREHGIKLIEYMNMRGAHHPGAANKDKLLKELEPLLKHAKECKIFDKLAEECAVNFDEYNLDGVKSFNCALKMEMAVTEHVKDVIKQCETDWNDYHYVDYLTGEFLTEQYEGQRKIAGHLKTLEKMSKTHGNIGEFFFDKTLLE